MRNIPDLPLPSSDVSHAHALGRAQPRVSVAGGFRPELVLTLPEGVYARWGKRVTDIVLASAFGLLVLPWVPLLSLAIWVETRMPILYRSVRLGKGERPFVFLKFRSMFHGAHESARYVRHLNELNGPVFKSAKDPRVTKVGRFLRRTSLDELPQLWNVLRGEMSLVGPRPPIPEEVEAYEPWQRLRLSVKPGITCLWQVSGRSKLGFEEWMRLDIEYIQSMSLATDLKILLRTVPAVLSREGAY